MEEIKYHRRINKANMSHLLNIFNKSKTIMLVMVFFKLIFDSNYIAPAFIFIGYLIMLAWTNKLERSKSSNNKSVMILAHSITILKVITSISATIRMNKEPPTGMQPGVVIAFILTMEAMKSIEPAYKKAIKMFVVYWSFYLIALSIYYQTLMLEQFCHYGTLFWLIYQIYKENYELSNSLTEIFYDFHNDPVILYEGKDSIKVNKMFVSFFDHLIKSKKMYHHSQMLTEWLNPNDIILEYLEKGIINKISVYELVNKQEEMNKKELILRKEDGDKIFVFTFYRLENIYNAKTVCIFKETTHIHEIQKVADRVRSVINGCLTHELRTPVNCVISIFKSLGDYIDDSDEARRLFSICEGTIELLRSLTEDFIDFTRFENDKGLPIHKEIIDISEFTKSIENIFKYQAEEKDLQFTITKGLSVPPTFYTDEKRLKQVMLNLLSNAFKFTQAGKIEIKLKLVKNKSRKRKSAQKTLNSTILRNAPNGLKRLISNQFLCESENLSEDNNEIDNSQAFDLPSPSQRKFLWIQVNDTGIGMNPEEYKNIFVKFGMGRDAQKLNTNGLGLGLYLSKEIIKNLGGSILFSSKKDKGSTFKIMLPFEKNSEQDFCWIDQIMKNDENLSDENSWDEMNNFDEFLDINGLKDPVAFDQKYDISRFKRRYKVSIFKYYHCS